MIKFFILRLNYYNVEKKNKKLINRIYNILNLFNYN